MTLENARVPKRQLYTFTCNECGCKVTILADPDYDSCPMYCCFVGDEDVRCEGELLLK